MRTGILIGRESSGKYRLILDPATPILDQRVEFKRIKAEGGSGLASLDLWESGSGICKRVKFSGAAPVDQESKEPESKPHKKGKSKDHD